MIHHTHPIQFSHWHEGGVVSQAIFLVRGMRDVWRDFSGAGEGVDVSGGGGV